jgi:lipoate-protein ligase A
MEYDLKLFHDFEKGLVPSTLRIYSWRPNCISLGYSQKMDRLIDEEMASKMGWDVVKRPTGGGIVFHNEAEVTYSIVTEIDNPILPEGLVPSYMKISEALLSALKNLGIEASISRVDRTLSPVGLRGRPTRQTLCFSYPAEYEIICNGRKIIGSAQKRGKRTLLQQGSINVRETPVVAFKVLKDPYHKQNAISLEDVIGRQLSFSEISQALSKGFEGCFGVSFACVKCDKMQLV